MPSISIGTVKAKLLCWLWSPHFQIWLKDEYEIKLQHVTYNIYKLYKHTHTHIYICVCVYIYIKQNILIIYIYIYTCVVLHDSRLNLNIHINNKYTWHFKLEFVLGFSVKALNGVICLWLQHKITFYLSKYWTGLTSLISLSSPAGGNVTLSIKQNHFSMQHSFNLISACFFRPVALVRGRYVYMVMYINIVIALLIYFCIF